MVSLSYYCKFLYHLKAATCYKLNHDSLKIPTAISAQTHYTDIIL